MKETKEDEVQHVHFHHREPDQKQDIETALYSIRDAVDGLTRMVKELIEAINADEDSIGEKLGVLIEDLSTLKSNDFNS